MLIAVEGIDGAGKNTLVTALTRQFGECQRMSFPRYEDSVPAQLAARALAGEMGDLIGSAHGMATLFALDRHRYQDELCTAAEDPTRILLLDRYVASNAAYTSARLNDPQAAEWVAALEFDTLRLPRPAMQVLLDAPVALARERAERREAHDSSRTRDAYEKDTSLQERTAEAYRRLAQQQWNGAWMVAEVEDSPSAVAAAVAAHLGMEV